MNKIKSYLGFAIKSKNILIGQTQLKLNKKPLSLVMVCNSASNNLKDLAKHVANKFKAELIITKPILSEITNLDNIKIIGITDENLSKAIIENKEKINIG